MKIEGFLKKDPSIEVGIQIEKIKIFCDCGKELKDGNFKMIDGNLVCLDCANSHEISVIPAKAGIQ